jgi:hypothetical protein
MPTPAVLRDVMEFRVFPYGFDILPLYMVMLLIAPLFLGVMRKNILAALAGSVALYVAAQSGLSVPASVRASGSTLLRGSSSSCSVFG